MPFPRQQPPAVTVTPRPGALTPSHPLQGHKHPMVLCPPVGRVGSPRAAPAVHGLLPPLPCTGEALAAARLKGTGSPDWGWWNGLRKNLF